VVLDLSKRAKQLLAQTNVKGQIILEIDGFEDQAIFGAVDIEKFARIGEDELTIGEFFIGGVTKDTLSRPYISLTGTSTKVGQQIIPDQGGTSSIQTMNIQLIDKDDELSRLFSPGQVVPDLHGVKARVYAAFQNGAHPEDSVLLLSGIIKQTTFGAGYVRLGIAHPEELKRRELFTSVEGVLSAAIDDTQTTIPLELVTGILIPEDVLTTFVVIEDEIIQYTGVDTGTNELTGCTRGVKDTIAVAHDIEETVSTYYQIEEATIPLALKLLFSGPKEFFVEDLPIKAFEFLSPSESVENAVAFSHPDIQFRYGLSIGDKLTITGATEGANNVTSEPITGFGTFDGGSYCILGGATLVEETDTPALVSMSSFYRAFTQSRTGCNLSPELVDVERFLFWEDLFGSTYPTYRFQLMESFNCKEFLDTQILFPTGLYSVPRKGRISLQFSLPPLAVEDVVTLDLSNVMNPEKLKLERSTVKFFYNTIDYRVNYDPVKDKYFRKDIRISNTSLDRIDVGIKKMLIESRGLKSDIDSDAVVTSISKRLLDRYKYGAERIKGVKVNYKTGMPLEVADSVVLDGKSLRMTDTGRGDRNFAPRLFEIINKEWDYAKGTVTLDLLDTAFDLSSRFGIMGPSSWTSSGSTTEQIRVKRSFATSETDLEVEKWSQYVGSKIIIRADDFSFEEEVTLEGFLPSRNDTLLISPLSVAPPEDYVVVMPDYSGDSSTKAIWKNLHCFVAPVVDVVSGIDDFSFTVDGADISKFFIGGFVRVHNADFTNDSERQEITDIIGNTITVGKSLGFTPQAGDETRPIGFSDDNGSPYNYL